MEGVGWITKLESLESLESRVIRVIRVSELVSVSRNKIIRNSTQKVSSRVLNSRNMMSVARTS